MDRAKIELYDGTHTSDYQRNANWVAIKDEAHLDLFIELNGGMEKAIDKLFDLIVEDNKKTLLEVKK